MHFLAPIQHLQHGWKPRQHFLTWFSISTGITPFPRSASHNDRIPQTSGPNHIYIPLPYPVLSMGDQGLIDPHFSQCSQGTRWCLRYRNNNQVTFTLKEAMKLGRIGQSFSCPQRLLNIFGFIYQEAVFTLKFSIQKWNSITKFVSHCSPLLRNTTLYYCCDLMRVLGKAMSI